MPQPDHRLDEARVAGAVGELGEKRRVDLQRVERELADRRERRVAGAEAVQGDAHADAAQVVELRHRDLALAGEHRLGDLEHEQVGIQAAAAQRARHRAREPGRGEVARGDVDVDRGRLQLGVVAEHLAPARELAAGEHEDLGPERHGEPGRLAGGEELRGREQPVVGVLPAHERLDGDDRARRQVEDRLIVQAQLAVGQRAPQALLDLGGVQQAPAHAPGRELRARAATLACPRRGRARRAQDLRHRRRPALGQHDTDARRHRQLAPAGEHRLRQRGADALGDVERLAVGGDARDEHGEVVAGEAPGGRVGGQHALQARADADEHLVAGAVAEAVVELAEAVEVDEQHGRVALLAPRAIERLLEAVLEERAVRKPRQRILQPEPRDLLVGAPARDRRADDVRDRLREALVAGRIPSGSAVATARMPIVAPRSPCMATDSMQVMPAVVGMPRVASARAAPESSSDPPASIVCWRMAACASPAGSPCPASGPRPIADSRRSPPSGSTVSTTPRSAFRPSTSVARPEAQRSSGACPASALWPSATTSAWRAIRSARSCSTSLWSVMSRMKPVYVACGAGHPRDRDLDRERRAVRALRLELDALVEDAVRAAVEQPLAARPGGRRACPAG